SRDPTGHGRSTAAAGAPDPRGTPIQQSGRQCVSTHPYSVGGTEERVLRVRRLGISMHTEVPCAPSKSYWARRYEDRGIWVPASGCLSKTVWPRRLVKYVTLMISM